MARGSSASSGVPWRIGHGFDVHAFASGDHLMLGGVRIPFDRGFLAHSDGDVLIHAVCDALLGAAGLGDIGRHFPDTDPRYADIDSKILLRQVVDLLVGAGWEMGNIDATIIAQAPRMAPWIDEIEESLAMTTGMDTQAVNVKATTTERLGFAGRSEGIAVEAVALIVRQH